MADIQTVASRISKAKERRVGNRAVPA